MRCYYNHSDCSHYFCLWLIKFNAHDIIVMQAITLQLQFAFIVCAWARNHQGNSLTHNETHTAVDLIVLRVLSRWISLIKLFEQFKSRGKLISDIFHSHQNSTMRETCTIVAKHFIHVCTTHVYLLTMEVKNCSSNYSNANMCKAFSSAVRIWWELNSKATRCRVSKGD